MTEKISLSAKDLFTQGQGANRVAQKGEPRSGDRDVGIEHLRPWHDVTPLKKLVSNF